MPHVVYQQIYTLDKDDPEKLLIVGYSALNIFVESGTTTQPVKDDVASTVRYKLELSDSCNLSIIGIVADSHDSIQLYYCDVLGLSMLCQKHE